MSGVHMLPEDLSISISGANSMETLLGGLATLEAPHLASGISLAADGATNMHLPAELGGQSVGIS